MTATCAITGTTGYLGSRLSAFLASREWTVRGLNRRGGGVEAHTFPFALGRPIEARALEGASALVHAAYDFAVRDWPEIERVNVQGSRALLAAARAAGVARVLFISTLSAFEGCRSLYGRAKLAIEKAVLDEGGIVVRPGLVYGDSPGGMVGRLSRVAALPVVPLFASRQRLYTAHEEDVCALVARLLQGPVPVAAPITAAARTPIPFGDLVARLAARKGRSVRTIEVPWRLAWAGLRALELAGVRPSFRSDSVLSLATLGTEPDFSALDAVGTSFRAFA